MNKSLKDFYQISFFGIFRMFSHFGIVGIKIYHTYSYYVIRQHLPNFKNPQDLSERILSSIQKKSFYKYADLADKVKVRDYVKSKGLESILLKNYGTWENAKDINFDLLPKKMALKTNNGSGGHIFCKDKSILNVDDCVQKLNENLKLKKLDYAWEPHYKKIKPLVFCEELIDTGTDSWPTDFKFTCIHGQIVDVFVAVEREVHAKYCTFDTEWNVLNYTKKSYLPDILPSKPKMLPEMIEIAKKLSADFEFVRVDLYENDDKIYFGELTFSPWGGMMYSYTNEALSILGNKFIQ